MPVYRIIPLDNPLAAVEITGLDGASALNMASTMDLNEADVWQNGEYSFSVRKRSLVGPFWKIFPREDARTDPLIDMPRG